MSKTEKPRREPSQSVAEAFRAGVMRVEYKKGGDLDGNCLQTR